MYDLPTVNSLLYLAVDEQINYRSRVEDVEGNILTVAAPIGIGDLQIPGPGSEFPVFWVTTRTRIVMPVSLMGVTREPPPRWRIQPTGEPQRMSRRRFVRGGGGSPVHLNIIATPEAEEDTDPVAVDGVLIDISEGGLRCRVPQINISAGHQVWVQTPLGEDLLDQAGTVVDVRPAERRAVDIVMTYELPEHVAQMVRRHIFTWEIAQRRAEQDQD